MKLRIARHTSNLSKIVDFYTLFLGLEVLGEFQAYEEYNGVFIGKKGLDWNLEFTTSTELPNHTFDADDMLVFYPKTTEEFSSIMQKVEVAKIKKLVPKNPYWSNNGFLIQDFDCGNVVVYFKGLN